MLTTVQGVFTCDTIDTLTLRNIFGSSGGRACGRGIRASTKAKSNISTIKFCNPSYYSFTCTISESIIFMTSPSTCPYLQWRAWGSSRLIGASAKNNWTKAFFYFLLRTESLHPYRMNWRVNMRTIIPYTMNNGVTLCSLYNLKIIVKGVRPRSRGFQPPIQSSFILISTTILGCCIIRRRVLVSYLTANNIVKDPQSSRGSALFCSLHKDINLWEKRHFI